MIVSHLFLYLWNLAVSAAYEIKNSINIKTMFKPLATLATSYTSCQNKDVETDTLTNDSLGLWQSLQSTFLKTSKKQ